MSEGAAAGRVVVFAKAPVPGQAKTRLARTLGNHRAAALADRLLRHAVAEAVAADAGVVELCTTPDRRHPAFAALATRHPALVLDEQGEGHLGERMHRALARGLRGHPAVLLMGTDAPALDRRRLAAAAQALARPEVDVVLVPALDGGYALVGLKHPAPVLFDAIPWSTSAVMAATRARARTAGLRLAELPAVADIDEAADLCHLPAGWPA